MSLQTEVDELVVDKLTDLLRGTGVLSPDDRALPLSSPAPPAFSTTPPEHVLGPDTEILVKVTVQHLTGGMISNQISS